MNRAIKKTILLGKTMDSPDISDLVDTMSFTESTDKHNSLELRASDTNAKLLMENPGFYEGCPVIVSYGYIQGEMSLPRLCVLSDIEPDYAGGGGISLTVKFLDKGVSLKRNTATTIWKNMNTRQIVQNIADAHGLELNMQDTGGFKTYDSLPQSGMTDMQFLKFLARNEKSGNYFITITDNVLNFITKGTGNASVETVEVGKNPNVIRFSPRYKESSGSTESKGSSLSDGTTGVSANPYSEDGGKRQQEHTLVTADGAIYLERKDGQRVPAFQKGSYRVGENTYVEITTDNTGRVTYNKPNTPNRPEAAVTKSPTSDVVGYISNFFQGKTNPADAPVISDTDTNNANYDFKNARDRVLTAVLIEYGNPSRTINTIITIDGQDVYDKYKGNWYVKEVTHDFQLSGYTTRTQLTKDGLAGKGILQAKESNTTRGETEPGVNTKVTLVGGAEPGITTISESNVKTGNKVTPITPKKGRYDK